MKKVLCNNELKKVMKDSVNMLCNAVASTLGPTGNNVLINNSEELSFITNDGVTIANYIESDNIEENTILEIVKEASLKTNELVGDGTSTTLVLLQSIFNNGLVEIEKGVNPILLKKELYKSLNYVINELNKLKMKPSKKDLNMIASISANDKQIGDIVYEVYSKVNNVHSIKIEQSNGIETYYEIKKGYSIDIDFLSSIYFKNINSIKLNNCLVLVLKGYLDNLESISSLINNVFSNDKDMVIFVEDMDDIIKQEVLSYYINNKKNIFIVKLSEYGIRRDSIENDISILSGCNIKNINIELVDYNDLGSIDSVIISKEEINLLTNKDNSNKLLDSIKEELNTNMSDYDLDFIYERISKLDKGIAHIYVGGITKTEIKEKIMRFEDSIHAIDVANNGIIPGEGLTLLKISSYMKCNNTGDYIMKKALEVPFNTIINNIGKNINDIKRKIISYNYTKIYNYEIDDLEDISISSILDPIDVVINSIKNSISIAAMLLTTNYLVINEQIKSSSLTNVY